MIAVISEPVRGTNRQGEQRTRPLNRVELLTYIALTSLVTDFDRTEHRVANAQVLELVPGDPRDVRRALSNLATAGVIEREPGTPGQAPLYRFPVPDDKRGTEPHSERGTGPQTSGVGDPAVGGTGPQGQGSQHPTSEVLSEASYEEREVTLVDLAIGRVIWKHDELPALLEVQTTEYGSDRVRVALETMTANGSRYEYPSQWRTALRRMLDRSRPAVVVDMKPKAKCEECNGSRMVPGPIGTNDTDWCPSCGGSGYALDTYSGPIEGEAACR